MDRMDAFQVVDRHGLVAKINRQQAPVNVAFAQMRFPKLRFFSRESSGLYFILCVPMSLFIAAMVFSCLARIQDMLA